MFLNERMMPEELLYYKALEVRTELTSEEKRKMYSLQKGYEGECLYDKIFDEVGHENLYIFRDVYLKIGKSITQYDSIIVSNNSVVVNEIKNFTGDYRFENKKWYTGSKELADDAFVQLSRAKSKIIKLRDDAGVNFKVDSGLIFPSDDFRLLAEDHNIWNETILRNQMRNYFRQFGNENVGEKAKRIAMLIKNSIEDNPYFSETADIEKLRRGLYCGECGDFNLIKGRFQLTCHKCGTIESNETHLLRAMNDHKALFFNVPMTKQSLLRLIDYQLGTSTVYRMLQKNCHMNLNGNSTSYNLKYYSLEAGLRETRKSKRYKDKIRGINV